MSAARVALRHSGSDRTGLHHAQCALVDARRRFNLVSCQREQGSNDGDEPAVQLARDLSQFSRVHDRAQDLESQALPLVLAAAHARA